MEAQNPETPESGLRALIHFRLKHKNSDDSRRKSSVISSFSDSSGTKKNSFLSSRSSIMTSFRTLRSLAQTRFGSGFGRAGDRIIFPKKPSKISRCIERYERTEVYKRTIKWQKVLYLMLEDPGSSVVAKAIFVFIISCIFFTIIEALIDSYETPISSSNVLTVLEWIVSMTFTVELGLRWFACTAFGMKRWVYLLRPLNIIDLISLVPFYLNLILTDDIVSINTLKTLRIIRFVRIIRVLKLGRYMKGTETFLAGLWTSLLSLGFIIYFVFVGNISFAVALYYAEYGSVFDTINDPDRLVQNIGDSMWWAIVTMTTTGYGDLVPQTVIGKVIGFITAIIGMFLLAIPIVILGSNFQQAFTNKQEADRVEKYKEKQRNENKDLDDAQREIRFMNDRVELIEKTNNDITDILNDSKQKYYSVAKDLKHLYSSIYAGDEKKAEEEKQEVAQESTQAVVNKIDSKIKIMEKLMKAKRKIKIANLFPKGLGNKSIHLETDRRKSITDTGGVALSRTSSKRLSIDDRGSEKSSRLDRKDTLFEANEEEFVEGVDICAANRVQVSIFENRTTDFSVSPTKLRPSMLANTIKEESKASSEPHATKSAKNLDNGSGLIQESSLDESMHSITARGERDRASLGNGDNNVKKRSSLTSRMKNSVKKRKSGRKLTLTSGDIRNLAEKNKKVLNLAVRIVELLGEQEEPANSVRTNLDELDLRNKEEDVGTFSVRNPLMMMVKTERKLIDSVDIEDSTDEPSEKMGGHKKRSPEN